MRRLHFLLLVFLAAPPAFAALPFDHVVIDAANPADPHCKTLGDIDGDGLLDAVAASSAGGGMFWYEYPSWTKHPIRTTGSWTTDMQAADVDGDGDLDVAQNGHWLEQISPTSWTQHTINASWPADTGVLFADIDGNGTLDFVIAPSESSLGRLSWYEAIDPRAGPWIGRPSSVRPDSPERSTETHDRCGGSSRKAAGGSPRPAAAPKASAPRRCAG